MLKHIRSSSQFRSPRQINESLTGMFAGPFCVARLGRRQSDSVMRRYMPSRVLNCVFISSRLPVASLHDADALAITGSWISQATTSSANNLQLYVNLVIFKYYFWWYYRATEDSITQCLGRKTTHRYLDIYNVNINKLTEMVLSSMYLKPGVARLVYKIAVAQNPPGDHSVSSTFIASVIVFRLFKYLLCRRHVIEM